MNLPKQLQEVGGIQFGKVWKDVLLKQPYVFVVVVCNDPSSWPLANNFGNLLLD
jgi:hypothetical protein